MLMSNGLHYQGARQKGNGMIAPIIPACSPFPPLLFSLCLLAIQTVSPLASSLSSPFPPFTTSLLLPRPTSVQLEEVPHLLHTEEEGGDRELELARRHMQSGDCIQSASVRRNSGWRGGRKRQKGGKQYTVNAIIHCSQQEEYLNPEVW